MLHRKSQQIYISEREMLLMAFQVHKSTQTQGHFWAVFYDNLIGVQIKIRSEQLRFSCGWSLTKGSLMCCKMINTFTYTAFRWCCLTVRVRWPLRSTLLGKGSVCCVSFCRVPTGCYMYWKMDSCCKTDWRLLKIIISSLSDGSRSWLTSWFGSC